ncbi:carboxypeptidase-like regulatory domain-containing protein [Robiginitalea sp. M366]|uniref:carboxypeptidase-like regulatory domain-containing protein n=1 Tax=Robiginitalea aestuariiviva TaxID=3036903 RepID=UPI00240E62FA|nr:carboxypeptidase-like regulatory domain-containing protein [Robiginitalea aestuariiviva]MDG1573066.1 carboxypeptidase-like regulatory domain-containing protein [Robiginitalea aestuariiviva]
MKKILVLIALMAGAGLMAQQRTITGRVTDGRTALENVAVQVEGSQTSTFTDAAGRYTIAASPGDDISFTYQGMKPLSIRVEDVTRILNPTLVMDVAQLDEVVVVGSNRKTQKELAYEYPVNNRLIRTAYGILNADTAPGKVQFMNEEDINPVTLCILDLLRNQFPGVRVQGDCIGAGGIRAGVNDQLTNLTAGQGIESDAGNFQGFDNPEGGRVFIRGASSIFNQRSAIFDVDGQIFYTAPVWLDVKQIKRLAILNNFATTTQYGNVGAGGVIVINTMSGSPRRNALTDMARLRNNYVRGDVLSPEQVAANAPTYLMELRNAGSTVQAREVYETYAGKYSGSPFFFLDAYRHFFEVRKEEAFADALLEEHQRLFAGNPVLLKALAYVYQAQGRYTRANTLYKEVMGLRAQYGQSYMDLANSYRELGEYDKAAGIYQRYAYLTQNGMMPQDSLHFGPILERENNNLLYLHRASIVGADKRSDLYVAEENDFKGTRLVFEWNDGEAEFDLQFVNPEGQYFNWNHSMAASEEVIRQEKRLGYSAQEFLIDESLPGNWEVNVTYQGNKSLTPTYLKVTIYDQYGTRAQRKETRVFQLKLKDVPQRLFSLAKSVRVAMN